MGKIIDRVRARDKAKQDTVIWQLENMSPAQINAWLVQEPNNSRMVLEPLTKDSEGIGPQVAQLTKRVHSLEFQVLRLTPGTREWAEAREEQFERKRRAEERQFLARRAERRAFWAAIARLMGLRRG